LKNSVLIACSCDTISFEKAVEYADEIFVGEIVKAEKFESGKFINSKLQEETLWDWKYHFKIRKKWKGNSDSELIVYHQSTSCDLFFDIYKSEYLVYAAQELRKEYPIGVTTDISNNKNRLSTWLCSRTVYNDWWRNYNDTISNEIWYKDDVIRLGNKFPEEIILSKNWYQKSWIIIITAVLILSILVLIVKRKIRN